MNLSKTQISKYTSLQRKKGRDREGMFLVQGAKAVADTIGHFKTELILIDNKLENVPSILDGEPILRVSENDIKKISTLDNPPEIVAIYKIPETTHNLKRSPDEFAIVLDGIQDPGNIGTIIRTAHWFGIDTIFCSKGTADIFNPKVVQSTMGSIAKVKIIYCDLSQLFENNPETPVYGLLLEGENIFTQNKFQPGFILMGSEGHGPKEETLAYVTKKLTIPAKNPSDAPDSLNVGVATAITISQMIK